MKDKAIGMSIVTDYISLKKNTAIIGQAHDIPRKGTVRDSYCPIDLKDKTYPDRRVTYRNVKPERRTTYRTVKPREEHD